MGRERFLLSDRSGRTIVVEDSAAPIHDAQGRLSGAVAVIADCTERLQGEREREQYLAELQRSNAELARFSYTVAHDLKAPLRTVNTFAELLQRDLAGDLNDQTAARLTLLREAASGMSNLIQALLRYAQVGEAPLQPEWVAVTDVLKSLELMLCGPVSESRADVEYANLPVVWADRTQLHQLLQNLLANAIQYRCALRPPHITVSAETTAEAWHFAVTDRGQGIPDNQLERVFAPMTRLHGPDIAGTGLGLALCRTIVERHGGRIWAESPGQDQGTTIRFVIPRPAATKQPQVP